MSYTKMTPSDFISKLEDGGYKSDTAAKRAIGKAKFNDAGKDKCYKAIVARFGEKPEAPAKGKAGKKGKVPAKANAKGAKKAAKAKSEEKAARLFDGTDQALKELDLANLQVGTIVQAINAMRSAKEAYPDLDTKVGAETAQAALTEIMEGVHASVTGTAPNPSGNGAGDPAIAERFARSAPAAVALPGQVFVPTPGDES